MSADKISKKARCTCKAEISALCGKFNTTMETAYVVAAHRRKRIFVLSWGTLALILNDVGYPKGLKFAFVWKHNAWMCEVDVDGNDPRYKIFHVNEDGDLEHSTEWRKTKNEALKDAYFLVFGEQIGTPDSRILGFNSFEFQLKMKKYFSSSLDKVLVADELFKNWKVDDCANNDSQEQSSVKQPRGQENQPNQYDEEFFKYHCDKFLAHLPPDWSDEALEDDKQLDSSSSLSKLPENQKESDGLYSTLSLDNEDLPGYNDLPLETNPKRELRSSDLSTIRFSSNSKGQRKRVSTSMNCPLTPNEIFSIYSNLFKNMKLDKSIIKMIVDEIGKNINISILEFFQVVESIEKTASQIWKGSTLEKGIELVCLSETKTSFSNLQQKDNLSVLEKVVLFTCNRAALCSSNDPMKNLFIQRITLLPLTWKVRKLYLLRKRYESSRSKLLKKRLVKKKVKHFHHYRVDQSSSIHL